LRGSGARQVEEINRDIALCDGDSLSDRFDDRPLVLRRQLVPTPIEVARVGDDCIARKELDLYDVPFGFEARDLLVHCVSPDFEGLVPLGKTLLRDRVRDVELVDPIHLVADPAAFGSDRPKEFLLLRDRSLGLTEVGGELIAGKEDRLELLSENRFEIPSGDLVAASRARVLLGL
jgi:hypothetical protein